VRVATGEMVLDPAASPGPSPAGLRLRRAIRTFHASFVLYGRARGDMKEGNPDYEHGWIEWEQR
jgi:hypothetical protein